jgi:hypothetical protein
LPSEIPQEMSQGSEREEIAAFAFHQDFSFSQVRTLIDGFSKTDN